MAQQSQYWQQELHYKIDVSLDPVKKTLDGYLQLVYHNHAPDTLKYIWFHLWPNAYKNDRTAFSEQLLQNGRTDFYFAAESKRGYINQLRFQVNDVHAITVDHPQHQDIIQVILPKALAPGDTCYITTPFHVKLPYNFSRGGYIDNAFQITQWYPKPAVYDHKGWHEMPYLDQGEFYSEFGSYEVNITLPKSYVLAATGMETNRKLRDSLQTCTYKQERVHDFAWFADEKWVKATDSVNISGNNVIINAYHYPRPFLKNRLMTDAIKTAILHKSTMLGDYPYETVSVVEGPFKGGSGMEYPTIAVIDQTSDISSLEEIVEHEVGHNWFYGILGNNEREHMWMDEGMNSYYDKRASEKEAGSVISTWLNKHPGLKKRMPDDVENMITETICNIKKDQPIQSSSAAFTDYNYSAIGYNKTAQWMQALEKNIGRAHFDSMMHIYFDRWKFKHPYPEDFFAVVAPFLNQDSNQFFSLLQQRGMIETTPPSKSRKLSWMNFNNTRRSINLYTLPAIGYNFYDGLMAGPLIHNYTLPLTKFNFIISPMYGFQSGKLNGFGYFSYTPFRNYSGSKLKFDLNVFSYHTDVFKDSTGIPHYFLSQKWVPGVQWQLGNKDPHNETVKTIAWKTFLFRETQFQYFRDTTLQQNIITFPVLSSYLNQLKFTVNNKRVLNPYRLDAIAEQNKDMIRLSLNASQYFNFSEKEGIEVRLFAGKFIYLNQKTFFTQYSTDRFHLNMTGANGYEDYTYSNYFIGRNEFSGIGNQQIMIRDGGFKIRTDLLSSKIGKSDDWLVSMNLCSNIPKKYNPLSLLPFEIPVRVFADFGTTPEYWNNQNTSERVLYDAGLQISLFKNVLNFLSFQKSHFKVEHSLSDISGHRSKKMGCLYSQGNQWLDLCRIHVPRPNDRHLGCDCVG